MRISDWSSDVCSSDLSTRTRSLDAGLTTLSLRACWPLRMRVSISPRGSVNGIVYTLPAGLREAGDHALVAQFPQHDPRHSEFAINSSPAASHLAAVAAPRSEEHTSDLQSLMRISYADS